MFISIGSFCHPAANLKMLGLRQYSFPFDWLYMHNQGGFRYINHLIETNFIHFTEKPVYNQRHKVISSYYPEVEFYHQDLIKNEVLPDEFTNKGRITYKYHENLIDTMKRRATRFMEFITNREENIIFVCTLQYSATLSDTHIYNDMLQFDKNKKIQCKYKVLVLLYHDTEFDYKLPEKYLELEHFIFKKYIRNWSVHPTFGDSKDFQKILLDANLI